MEEHAKKSFLQGIPTWALALFSLIGATIVMFVLASGLSSLKHLSEVTGEAISYTLYGVVITVGCYFISKRNPGSFWYVVLICNAVIIISAVVEPNFWITKSMWIPMFGGFVLSVIAAIAGARKGKVISDD
ncbi:MAG: hypothetical protein R6W31_08495 [Bacteroidales bacterium]